MQELVAILGLSNTLVPSNWNCYGTGLCLSTFFRAEGTELEVLGVKQWCDCHTQRVQEIAEYGAIYMVLSSPARLVAFPWWINIHSSSFLYRLLSTNIGEITSESLFQRDLNFIPFATSICCTHNADSSHFCCIHRVSILCPIHHGHIHLPPRYLIRNWQTCLHNMRIY